MLILSDLETPNLARWPLWDGSISRGRPRPPSQTWCSVRSNCHNFRL